MRRISIAMALAFALVFGIAAASTMADEMMSKSLTISVTKDLIGAAVKNPQGEFLGVINDFVQEPDGRKTFAILNFGNYED